MVKPGQNGAKKVEPVKEIAETPASGGKSVGAGEALPPVGMGPFAGGLFSAFFMVVPTALAAVLMPIMNPEEKLAEVLKFEDPLAAPIFAVLFHLFVLQWLAMCAFPRGMLTRAARPRVWCSYGKRARWPRP